MSLSVGQRVRVVGLVQAQQHNGKPGSVSSAVDESSGRCGVTLDDGSSLNIKPINLVLEPDPPALSTSLSTASSRGSAAHPVTDRMSAWSREEEERVRLNPPPPLWDEVHDNRSIVFSHPQFKDMLCDWQLRAEPHETECPNGLMFHQAVVTADLPFLKAMGRYNANWNAVEKDTGRSALILIVLRARTQGMPYVVYPEDVGTPQQMHKRSLTATLRWYHITSSCPQHRVLHAPPTHHLHPQPSECDVHPHLTPRLLSRGADPNLKDKYNASPLQYAVQPERLFGGAVPGASPIMVDMAKLLIEYGGFCLASWRCAFEIDACPSSGADAPPYPLVATLQLLLILETTCCHLLY